MRPACSPGARASRRDGPVAASADRVNGLPTGPAARSPAGRRSRSDRLDRASDPRDAGRSNTSLAESTRTSPAHPDVVEAGRIAVGVHARRLDAGWPGHRGLRPVCLGEGRASSRAARIRSAAGSSGSALKSPITIWACGARAGVEPVEQVAGLLVALGRAVHLVMEVGHDDQQRPPRRQRHDGPERGPVAAQLEPVDRLGRDAARARAGCCRTRAGPPSRGTRHTCPHPPRR